MEQEEKIKCIHYYLEKYFNGWLIRDLKSIVEIIKDKNEKFTLPPILLVNAGIDFLGGLEYGFKNNNSGCRSRKFIEDWMGKINKVYKEEKMSKVIYDLVRCGSVHQGIYKIGVEISSDNSTENHLKISPLNNIFLSTLQFASDFIEAQRIFRKEYIKNNIEKVYKNLNETRRKTWDFDDLINRLKINNNIINVNRNIFSGTSQAPQELDFKKIM